MENWGCQENRERKREKRKREKEKKRKREKKKKKKRKRKKKKEKPTFVFSESVGSSSDFCSSEGIGEIGILKFLIFEGLAL